MKIKLFGIGLAFLLIAGMMADGGLAQQTRSPFPPRRGLDREPSFRLPSNRPSLSREMLRESFEKTQTDTAHLYELATELKDEMDDATEDVLSVTVMKKAEEIEKLAEDIKNRMKNL
jgi:hypothetical protein